jgi:hypothetical protein
MTFVETIFDGERRQSEPESGFIQHSGKARQRCFVVHHRRKEEGRVNDP